MDDSGQQSTILFVQGGCGDVIAATPMIRAARKALPDDRIVILSTYSAVLKHNPNIDLLIPLADADEVKDFYSEYVHNHKVRYFKKFFPYDHICDEPAKSCNTVREFITNLYGFKEYFENDLPDYYITDYERRKAAIFLEQDSKPVVLLHIFGAVASENMNRMLCGNCQGRGIDPTGNRCVVCGGGGKVVLRHKTNSMKDLDPRTLEPLINAYKERYNFLQIGLAGEPLIEGAINCLDMPLRDTIALFDHDQVVTAICIESLFMHAAAALRRPIICVFQNTSPDFFGYDIHYNCWDSGGCKDWPCNRPVGALLDFAPGYTNPATRERLLWFCKDQICAKIKTEQLEKVFLEALQGKKESEPRPIGDQGYNTLEEAQDAGTTATH